ncbi:MAG: acyl-CoA dehydrogenase family protein [Parvibaculaceae bacterium]
MGDKTFLAWPFFAEKHRDLEAAAEDFATTVAPPLIDHHDADGSCRRLVAALGESGLLRHAVTAPHGGLSEKLDVRSLCLIRESLSYADGLADFAFAMQGLGTGPVTLFGSEAQKRRWLPPIAQGKAISAFALSEPDAGSDVAALACSAKPHGNDHVVIDGEKTWISNGGIADRYVVFCRTGEALGARGLSAFMVEAGTPGLAIAERLATMAPHPLARLRFENCRVPVENRIGQGGEGFKIAMATLDIFRSTVGAAALGFARRALDEALAHVASRRMMGGVLADLQIVQGQLADMALDVDASALMVYRAAWTKDQGAERITREAAMAKYTATEAAQRVIDTSVQLFGGLGVKSGSRPEQLYREIRALRIYEGASAVQKIIIARSLLSPPSSSRRKPGSAE